MIKSTLKSVFNSIGFRIMRNHEGFYPEWVLNNKNRINLLEVLIKLELKNGPFKFIQIGANDGIQADPLSVIIRKLNLKGTMIEPIPEIFEGLKRNCFDIIGDVELKNIALTVNGEKGLLPFYVFTTIDNKVPINLSGYSTTSYQKILSIKEQNNIEAKITKIEVEYESVSYYLNKNNIKSLNLLVTDVEGMDIDIVKEFFQCGVFPKIIYMEILGEVYSRRNEIIELLIKNKYLIGGNISDLIAYREV